MQDMMVDGTIVFKLQRDAFVSTGVPEQVVSAYEMMTGPWEVALRQQMKPANELRNSVTRMTGADKEMDKVLDPKVDEAFGLELKMRLLKKMGKYEYQLTEEERALLNDQVAGAIASMKGMRDFDVFSSDFKFPRQVPIQILMGQTDNIVPISLLNQYAQMIRDRNYPVLKKTLPSDHFFPQSDPEYVHDLIMGARENFNLERKRTRKSLAAPKDAAQPVH